MRISKKVVQKIFGSLCLIFIYVFASKLALPFVDVEKSTAIFGRATSGLELTTALTGGNLRTMSFISVGLSPWMSAMLLWKIFDLAEKGLLAQKVKEHQERWQMYLTLLISIIQSLVISLNLTYVADVHREAALLLATVVLVAGSFFLIWLVDLNSIFGVGGSLTIMMVGMLIYMPYDIYNTMVEMKLGWWFLVLLFLVGLILLYICICVERSKYQIPIQKVMINNSFERFSYINIKLNPAGGMPIMYAMTLVQFPLYVLFLLKTFAPKAAWLDGAIQSMTVGSPVWFFVYIFTISLLSVAFAYINVDPQAISKKMQASSEFIDLVYPGKETSKYIFYILNRLTLVGTIYLVFLSVLPMSMILWDIRLMRVSMIPGLFLIFFGMVFTIRDELEAVSINERYKKIF